MTPRCSVCGSPLAVAPCRRCGGALERTELLEPLRPAGPLGEFTTGIRLALRGASLTLTRPRLFSLVLLPIALNLLLFGGLVWLILDRRDLLLPSFDEPWILGLDWLRGAAAAIVQWLGVVLLLVMAAFATWILYPVVAAPFLEFLSEAVESFVLGQPDQTPLSARRVWSAWIVPVFQAAGVAIVQGGVAVLLFVASLTGVLSPLLVVGGCWMIAVTLCDIAIARKSFPVRERFARVNASFPLWCGLALPIFFVPFLLPLGVAGATLADLRERNREG